MRVLVLFLTLLPTVLFAQGASKSSADIAAAVARGTVSVRARLADGSTSSGSGFIVDASGTVVTNFHVVKDAKYVEIRLATDEVFPVAGTRAVDQWRDIAVLQIPGFALPTVQLGDSNSARPGERVMVIGTALGLLENSVTAGIVSGVRDVGGYRAIQMDAAISPGNSGGPVVREDGAVLGVATFKLRTGESLNFAVPINYVHGLLQLPVTPGLAQLASTDHDPLFAGNASGGSAENKSATAPAIPTVWRSTATGELKYLRIEGDTIFIDNVIPSALLRAGATSNVELKRVGDKWIGVHRERVNCRPMALRSRRICPLISLPMAITVLTPTLIQGTGEHQLYARDFNCRQCTYSGRQEPEPFTWVPN